MLNCMCMKVEVGIAKSEASMSTGVMFTPIMSITFTQILSDTFTPLLKW